MYPIPRKPVIAAVPTHTRVIEQENSLHGDPLNDDDEWQLSISEAEGGHQPTNIFDERINRQRLRSFPIQIIPTAQLATAEGILSSDNQNLFAPKTVAPHTHCGTVIRVDLDEGVHGFYVWIKHLIEALRRGSFVALRQEINEEAVLVVSDPKGWVRAQVGQTGKADLVLDVGLSAIMVPLSVLAIKAGIEETGEALEQHAELTLKHNKITENLKDLAKVAVENSSAPEIHSHAIEIEKQDLLAIDGALKHNFYNGGIGCNSLVSGGAILTRVVQDTTLKAVTAYSSQTGALATATTVIGVAGTVVLGPVAALAAVSMGSFFVHQGRKVAEELAQDREILAKYPVDGLSKTAYQTFINKEFTARERFTDSFKRWNIGFLTGACCYALSATAKAAIGIAALTGATTVLATPIGLAVILVLGIVGGIGMTMCSWQFLMCHGKSKKHQTYRLQESALLGRRLDALQTVYANGDGHSAASLRIALYEFVSKRDLSKRKFLHVVAAATKKFYQSEQSDNDDSADKEISKKRQPARTLLANLFWVSTYLSQRWNGIGHQQALDAAKKARGLQSDNLTTFDLVKWFAQHEPEQRTLLTGILTMQRDFLNKKIAVFEDLRQVYLTSESIPEEVRKTFEQSKQENVFDQRRLRKIEELLDDTGNVELNHLQRGFLQLEGSTDQEIPDDKLNARLAQHLIEELPEELTTTQGFLFDMHRRAYRLHDACEVSKNQRLSLQ